MTISSNEKLSQLNWVRAIAAFLVVGYHCEITMALPTYFGFGVLPFFKSGHTGVQLFFVLSGFVVFLAHSRDRERDWNVLSMFAFKRFRRIYPPLWIVLLPLTVMLVAGIGATIPTTYDVVGAFLILPVQNEVILGTEWTLRHEILFYLLFALFLWDRRLGLAILLAWAVVGSAVAVFSDQHWLIEFLLSPNHLLFLSGMGIAWVYLRGDLPAGVPVLAAGLTVFAASYALSLKMPLDADLSILMFGAGASGIIYGLAALKRLNRPVAWMDAAGASSYALYLIHYPLISMLLKLNKRLSGKIELNPYLCFLIIIVTCYCAAWAFHRWLEKPAIAMASSMWRRPPVAEAV
ncbi:hypothetical protein ASG39_06465 [Rhizobium sp. Leaf371]|uniref:acyltransferase family protein n=1 Tax=Rhizobium sp. Leaf371 TaxID=1736355 RepID=UPI0007137A40|nr:acyltransferase [Rhizobium sp. Leaf371]KQS67971.1 hypothetical protein ASG39_06465 [Rhizobium sp. Leaf371]